MGDNKAHSTEKDTDEGVQEDIGHVEPQWLESKHQIVDTVNGEIFIHGFYAICTRIIFMGSLGRARG